MIAACRTHWLLVSCLLGLAAREAVAQEGTAEPASPSEREAQLAERLTGATLEGYFTVTSRQAEGEPRLRGERYDLIEVRKLEGNQWLFRARIRYGDRDVTLPLTLPVEWAGDTPVVVVDQVGFPGLGTYSARVLFHQGHYAGHWSGQAHGGHLFGTIRPAGDDEEPASDEAVED